MGGPRRETEPWEIEGASKNGGYKSIIKDCGVNLETEKFGRLEYEIHNGE